MCLMRKMTNEWAGSTLYVVGAAYEIVDARKMRPRIVLMRMMFSFERGLIRCQIVGERAGRGQDARATEMGGRCDRGGVDLSECAESDPGSSVLSLRRHLPRL